MNARAKLFTHGGSQAVRLPKAFRFDGTEVSVRKDGDAVILEPVPVRKESWEEFWTRLDALRGDSEPFPYPPRDEAWGDPSPFDD